MKTTLYIFLIIFAFNSISVAQSVIVYQSDFSQGVNGGMIAPPSMTMNWSASNLTPNWSSPIETYIANGRTFLGQFGKQDASLSLAGLPPHVSVTVTFDFYALNTWDGNSNSANLGDAPDVFGLVLSGKDTLLYATFANLPGDFQTYPDTFPPFKKDFNIVNNLPKTGAFTVNQLGFSKGDAEYHLTYTFANSDDSILFDFFGKLVDINQNLSNESWGLDSVFIEIQTCVPPVPTIVGSLSLCSENSTVLKALPAGLSYQWMKKGQQLVTTDSLVVTDSGDYSVVVTNSSGCSDLTTVHVVVNALPEVSITPTDTITSKGAMLIASRGKSYLWNTGDTTQTIFASKPGTFFVTVTDSNGCSSTSPIFDFVPGCGDALLVEALKGLPITIDGIVPNPVNDPFTISFSNSGAAPIRYEIDDVLGRILMGGETGESLLTLSARDLPAGMLLLRASSNGFVQSRQFVVMK